MNKYKILNIVSNYLNQNINNENINKSINEIFMSNFSSNAYYNFLNTLNKEKNPTQQELFLLETNIFYKFCKKSIFELLLNPNTFYHKYSKNTLETNKSRINYNDINKLFLEQKIKLLPGDIKQNQNNTSNSGYHFLSEINNQLSQNFDFGTNILYAINDPQIECASKNKIKKMNLAGATFSFDDIYIGEIYDISDPKMIKEIFQEMAKINEYGETQIDVFYHKTYNMVNSINGFDALINRLKYIEFSEQILLENEMSKSEYLNFIKSNINRFTPEIYLNVITFINQAKEIYLQYKNNENFTEQFCSALDEICPGKLNIFDEKYQIEQFRETYGGKEFKEKFLNNLAKTAESLSDKEIKKLFLHKKAFIIKTKQEEICNIILNYNKNNGIKQIPILLLINDFKQMNRNELEKLEQIINEYINGNTQYLYDYLVRQESLDLIVEKMNPNLDQIIENNRIQEEQTEIQNTIEEAR